MSKKGLYALEALIALGKNYSDGPTKIHQITTSEDIPEKLLELILLTLKNARLVESTQGVNGGYRLKRPCTRR